MNRSDFLMFNEDIIYFDNGATTFKPITVIEGMNKYYNSYSANAHRGDYDISLKVDIAYEGVRDKLKDFINAKYREEIIFTSGSTDGLNMIANGFFKNILEAGDEILLTESEHASNVMPWINLVEEIGCNIRYIPLDGDYHVTVDNFKKMINSNTKVVSIAEITNVIGDIRPIDEITKIAHENNIFVVVDAAQSMPHKKIDVTRSDVDFLVASAHKMCGPTGVGILYGKVNLLEELYPTRLGGGMNESFNIYNQMEFKDLPHRLEAGTQNIAGVIGYGYAIDYLSNIGMDKIYSHELTLRKYLIDRLITIPHIDIINIEGDSGIVAFNVIGLYAEEVAYYLNKYNICVRAGSHCAKNLSNVTNVDETVRISLYLYNTESEIDELIELLSDYNKINRELL